jgi:hypothetical protein
LSFRGRGLPACRRNSPRNLLLFGFVALGEALQGFVAATLRRRLSPVFVVAQLAARLPPWSCTGVALVSLGEALQGFVAATLRRRLSPVFVVAQLAARLPPWSCTGVALVLLGEALQGFLRGNIRHRESERTAREKNRRTGVLHYKSPTKTRTPRQNVGAQYEFECSGRALARHSRRAAFLCPLCSGRRLPRPGRGALCVQL